MLLFFVFSETPWAFYLCPVNETPMSTASVTALINALRAETRENSISPESLGYILQKMIDEHAQSASGSGSSSTDSAAILALQALITSLDSSVSSLTSATGLLQTAVNNITAAQIADESQISAMQQEIDALTEQLGNVADGLTAIEETMASAVGQTEIDAMQNALVAMQQQMDAYNARILSLANSMDSLNETVSGIDNRVEAVELLSSPCLRFSESGAELNNIIITTPLQAFHDDALILIRGYQYPPRTSVDMLINWKTWNEDVEAAYVSRGSGTFDIRIGTVIQGESEYIALKLQFSDPVPLSWYNFEVRLIDPDPLLSVDWVALRNAYPSQSIITRSFAPVGKKPLDTDIAGTAARAIADRDGNIIDETYLKVADYEAAETDLSDTPIRTVLRTIPDTT